jgi:hypothetical protein
MLEDLETTLSGLLSAHEGVREHKENTYKVEVTDIWRILLDTAKPLQSIVDRLKDELAIVISQRVEVSLTLIK